MNILVVCTGNICRSPLAAVMLAHRLAERGRGDITVTSAGTYAVVDDPASEGSYLVALEHDLDLSAHRSRQLTEDMVAEADVIFGMSEHHVARVLGLGGTGRTHLLGTYAGSGGDDAEVGDPYGGDIEDYRVTWNQLDAFLGPVVERLLAESTEPGPGN